MKVTVIIPYKVDRGWLYDAICSVPKEVQLLVSQGNGNWPQNFNKALPEATGDYIKYLHDDDLLAPDCILNSVNAIESQNVDFIHGNVIEFSENKPNHIFIPSKKIVLLPDLLRKNTLHSATLLYKRTIFDTLGGFNENPKMYSFEEFEFNLRCLKAGFKIGYCDKVLAYYRRHPKQIIRTVDKIERQTNRNELVKQYLND